MSEHTRTPWTHHRDAIDIGIVADDGTKYHRVIPVASVHPVVQRPDEALANAALIVRAVNAHAPLVEALASQWCTNCERYMWWKDEVPHPLTCPKCRDARAALALARGEVDP